MPDPEFRPEQSKAKELMKRVDTGTCRFSLSDETRIIRDRMRHRLRMMQIVLDSDPQAEADDLKRANSLKKPVTDADIIDGMREQLSPRLRVST